MTKAQVARPVPRSVHLMCGEGKGCALNMVKLMRKSVTGDIELAEGRAPAAPARGARSIPLCCMENVSL